MNTQTRFPRTSAHIDAGVVSTLPAVRPATVVAAKALSKQEVKDFSLYEVKISDGFQKAGKLFVEIGGLLEEIRSRRLYREQFASWDDYCRVRWQKSTAWALMQRRAAEVMKNLRDAEPSAPKSKQLLRFAPAGVGAPSGESSPISPLRTGAVQAELLPRSESHVRPLTRLQTPAEQRSAWEEVKARARAGGAEPTESLVREVVNERVPSARQERIARASKESAAGMDGSKGAILQQANLVVVELRTLQDLVKDRSDCAGSVVTSVNYIERLEVGVRTGERPTTQQEAVWALRDAAACLGGLLETLKTLGDESGIRHAENSLLALKPLHEKFEIGNMRINRLAAEREQSKPGAAGFIIVRRPIPGSKTSSGKFRYRGAHEDWTVDPNKVTAFKSERQALPRCKTGDAVEALAQAVRRFSNGN